MTAMTFKRARTRTVLLAAGAALAGATAVPSLPDASPPRPQQLTQPQQTEIKSVPAARGPEPGTTYRTSDGWCHYTKWRGNFYCKSQYKHTLPNGYRQVFVIGTNKQVYTRWASGSGVSGWKSLGGRCVQPGNHSVDMWDDKGWVFEIACKGADGWGYLKTRQHDGKWYPTNGWSGPWDLKW